MLQIMSSIGVIVVMLAVILGSYGLCKKFVFYNIRINKYIPLAIAIVLFVMQLIFGKKINPYVNYGFTYFAVLFFLWFMEINQSGGPKKKEKQIKIKPKAKPNRVKNRNKENK